MVKDTDYSIFFEFIKNYSGNGFKGMGSKAISEKQFLSPHTINTHRRNILKKAQKSSITEVIYELETIGMI